MVTELWSNVASKKAVAYEASVGLARPPLTSGTGSKRPVGTEGSRDLQPTLYLARGFLKHLPANLALSPSSSSILRI